MRERARWIHVVQEDMGCHKNAADCGGLEIVTRSLVITRERDSECTSNGCFILDVSSLVNKRYEICNLQRGALSAPHVELAAPSHGNT
jgi:hypothetical protein